MLGGVLFALASLGACALTPLDDSDRDGFSDRVDCLADNAEVFPGAVEVCDGLDDDCDGAIDEAGALGTTLFFIDYDGDGAGTDRYTTNACAQPAGYVLSTGDCDDTRPDVHPNALELCDGVDNNCDEVIDESLDADRDGHPTCGTSEVTGDCNDADATIWVGAPESCDGKDNDCDGSLDELSDADRDGFSPCPTDGSPADCDDANPDINPIALELCNRIDDDCDGDFDEGYDVDEDGYTACGLTDQSIDCDDASAQVHPGADEACDGRDEDCDGEADDGFADSDGDGVAQCVDCDDADASINPLEFETCDGQDNNCNGLADDNSDCPCPVDYFGGHAYQFCTFTTDWATARDRCVSYGYHLVHIGTKEENDWILYTANTYLVIDWWIGLNDLETEGTFKWASGEPVTYTRWASGEPNNLNNEDCVQLYPDGTWNDKTCTSPWYRYICEAE